MKNSQLLVSNRTFEVINHGISGAVAGAISKFFLYPLGNVETRLQALAKDNGNDTSALFKIKETEPETSDSSNRENKKKPPLQI